MPKVAKAKASKNPLINDDIKQSIQNAVANLLPTTSNLYQSVGDTADNSNNIGTVVEQNNTTVILDTDDDKKKRRGRKPKDKFAFDDATMSSPDVLPENDTNIVIKIPINYMELDKEFNNSTSLCFDQQSAINKQLTTGNCNNSSIDDRENYTHSMANTLSWSGSRVPMQTEPAPFERVYTDSSYKFIDNSNSNYNLHGNVNNGTGDAGILAQCSSFNMHGDLPEQNSRNGLEFNMNGTIDTRILTQYPGNGGYLNPANEIIADLVDSNNKKQMTQVEILLEKKYKHTKQISLLPNFCVDDSGNSWISKTQSACYWDCHCFDHQPWGIPTKYNYLTGQFTMYGNFCSPNCVMSYLLTYETNTSTLWEKISLLNLLYYKVYENDDNIIPAPDKICIKLFGGPFDINEYRALTIKNNKLYNINFPPCNIITPVLEETKKVFNQESYFIPNDKKKHNKVQTELKIKRTRPITTNKNTIDSMLNRLE